MTNAPDRIWASFTNWRNEYEGHCYRGNTVEGTTPYIRLDLHEAAVAAARAEGMRAMAAIAEDVIESQNWTRGGVTDAAMEDMLSRIKASTPEASK